ncbi:hypothetical protein [Marinobacter sp. ELB17]|uniref:hypothetical protein n=1 Tax=Marinobacter sp. ELB17 TaxID=270374 RepID=UPI0002FFBFD3|nr:hypothetical protein [Marinobacter sp. ELB17]
MSPEPHKAELAGKEPNEFMLTNHAARAFSKELETDYQDSKMLPMADSFREQESRFVELESQYMALMESQNITAEKFDVLETNLDSARATRSAVLMESYVSELTSELEVNERNQLDVENIETVKNQLDTENIETVTNRQTVENTEAERNTANTPEELESLINEGMAAESTRIENEKTLNEVVEMLDTDNDEKTPDTDLDLSKLYKMEELASSTNENAFGAAVKAGDQRSLLGERVEERINSGEIEALTLSSESTTTLLTRSAKEEGMYQVTHFDKDFVPLSDSGEMTAGEAAREVTNDLDIRKLDNETIAELTGEDFTPPNFKLEQYVPTTENKTGTFDLVAGDISTQYTTAAAAGGAFFEAKASELPSIVHNLPNGLDKEPGNASQVIAETNVTGQLESGEPIYTKTLPAGNDEISGNFRTGYSESFTNSIVATFDQEPAQLSVENAEAKDNANKILELKPPHTEAGAKKTAQEITSRLEDLRGKPELKEAIIAVVYLADKSPELAAELTTIGQDNDYMKAVMAAAKTEVSQPAQQLKISSRDFEM